MKCANTQEQGSGNTRVGQEPRAIAVPGVSRELVCKWTEEACLKKLENCVCED